MVETGTFPWHRMDNSKDAISERSLRLAQRTATKKHHSVSDSDNMEEKKKVRRLIFRLFGSNLHCHLVHYQTVSLPQLSEVQTSTLTLGWHTFRDKLNPNNYQKMTLWRFSLCFWKRQHLIGSTIYPVMPLCLPSNRYLCALQRHRCFWWSCCSTYKSSNLQWRWICIWWRQHGWCARTSCVRDTTAGETGWDYFYSGQSSGTHDNTTEHYISEGYRTRIRAQMADNVVVAAAACDQLKRVEAYLSALKQQPQPPQLPLVHEPANKKLQQDRRNATVKRHWSSQTVMKRHSCWKLLTGNVEVFSTDHDDYDVGPGVPVVFEHSY